MTPSPQKIAELKAKALQATPGPWVVNKNNMERFNVLSVEADGRHIATWHGHPAYLPTQNAAFIAACDPAFISELITALEEATKPVELSEDKIQELIESQRHGTWTYPKLYSLVRSILAAANERRTG